MGNRKSPTIKWKRITTTLAYELALRIPEQGKEILQTQRQRIHQSGPLPPIRFHITCDDCRYLKLDSLFRSYCKRKQKDWAWAATTLSYLNHPTRQDYAVKYIRPALEKLTEVQRTGDIFFPRNWVGALLRNHDSEAAYKAVETFYRFIPLFSLLKNKILQAAYPLYRKYADKEK